MELRHEILGCEHMKTAESKKYQECLYNNSHNQLHFMKQEDLQYKQKKWKDQV